MLPLLPNSIVIAGYIADWNDIKQGQVCIVVSKSEGIVLKQVYNHIDKKGSFTLKSTNILYSPYELPAQEVLEIWRFVAYISKGFPEEMSTTTHDLKQAFWRLEGEMQDIKEKVENTNAFN